MSDMNEEVENQAAVAEEPTLAASPEDAGKPQGPSAADLAMAEAMAEQAMADQAGGAGGYTPPDFGQPAQAGEPEVNLDLILDVPVTLSMEVGHTRVPIRNLLQLNQGSVVELDRTAGEPLDVYVNGTLIAHGEVVVVNDKFGVRLLDVVSPSERIRKLK